MKRTNVVLVLLDDYGWKDSTCYGSEFYETPNLDKLAADGMRFTNAYASCPVCSPTRASMLTGKYWQWLKDLNFNALPTSLSVNANYNRSFNQQRYRDVLEPGVDALQLPLLQQRNYLFNWQYALNYSLSKSL